MKDCSRSDVQGILVLAGPLLYYKLINWGRRVRRVSGSHHNETFMMTQTDPDRMYIWA
ncbi:unnamed protein product [Dovyalis caffra]|uniref:Uncharacterized protein n=1 Tax=Dovyalis caffra TaxID=77055 RepID=A0AAV1R7A0_9ROSI|nr:unnamed protein product [Dovyalis caffra]